MNYLYDKRKSKDIQEEIKKLARSYLPQWKIREGEPGWALAKIFSFMQEEVIERINYIPHNLFIEFLERLGIQPEHAKPSEGYVVFKFSENLDKPVYLKKGVKISTENGIKFETQEDIVLNPVSVDAVISVNPDTDSVYTHKTPEKPLFPFSPQKHYLYAGDTHSFYFLREKGKNLYVRITPPVNGRWEYFHGFDNEGNEVWKSFTPDKRQFFLKDIGIYSVKKVFNKNLPLVIFSRKIHYYKKDPEPVGRKSVNGIDAYWLRVELSKLQRFLNNQIFEIKGLSGLSAVNFNDVPLDPELREPIKPFGEEPKAGDSFYIASDEAFSKKGASVEITITFKDQNVFPSEPNKISYEYWNGKSWKFLKKKVSKKENTVKINFKIPQDISQIEVNGERHYFIRIRLLNPVYGKYQILNNEVVPAFSPPAIKDIKIEFSHAVRPEYLLTYNNQEYKECKKLLYEPLPEKTKTLYIGLRGKLADSLNLFFSITCKKWDPDKYLIYKYWNGKKWNELQVEDGTQMFRKSGVVKVLIPTDTAETKKFGRELKWIKIEFFSRLEEEIYINGIFTNSVKIKQVETVKDEILGSSDGSPNQSFKAKNENLQDVQLYVKEPVLPEGYEYYQENDQFWVLWKEIDDLYTALPDQRVYAVDRLSGKIKFGDGLNGKIPPAGKNNIKISYSFGGGKKGNVESFKINSLLSSIPYVEEVFNPEKTYKGADAESFDQIFERFPEVVRHRGRAVNDYDYEKIIKRNFKEVVKLKIVQASKGKLLIGIYNDPEGKKKEVDTGFLYEVKNFLTSYLPATSSVDIFPPDFVPVDIRLTVVTEKINKITQVKNGLIKSLKEFLNPVKGDWDFGKFPYYSDFFPVITKVKSVLYVKSLNVTFQINGKKIPVKPSFTDMEDLSPFLLIMPGDINVFVEVEGAEYGH